MQSKANVALDSTPTVALQPEPALALRDIPDDELLRRLDELVRQARRVEADLVAHIGEVDERRLFARQAFPSMFVYCAQALHLSEAEAYRRITVARAARTHAGLLAMLRDGRLHLTGMASSYRCSPRRTATPSSRGPRIAPSARSRSSSPS